MNPTVEKLMTAGAVALAGLVAGKVLEKGWKLVTGHEAPVDFDDGETSIPEFVIYAAVSGAILAVARASVQKGTKRYLGRGPAKAS